MELESLRIFLAAAEAGGFSQASRLLYISHSTVSRRVSALERELGVKLFDRGGRSQTLTEAGRILEAEAVRIIRITDEAKEKLAAYKAE